MYTFLPFEFIRLSKFELERELQLIAMHCYFLSFLILFFIMYFL